MLLERSLSLSALIDYNKLQQQVRLGPFEVAAL